MAITAMAMVRKINQLRSANVAAFLSWFVISSSTLAGEWQFAPSLALEATHTDNVELTIIDPISSLVSQVNAGLTSEYQSQFIHFEFSGETSNVFYSHDHDLDDDFLTLDTAAIYALGDSGLQLVASANIDNISRNSAKNSLADLVSGDTIQSERYVSGLRYMINNNAFSVSASLLYNTNKVEDSIGEYDGVVGILSTENTNNARHVFWQASSSFFDRSSDDFGEKRTGEQFRIEALLGAITAFGFNPFIRYYDEDFSGNFTNQNQETTSSWGPGIRWLASPHLKIDVSYNYVADETVSDNYVSSSIQWEPSARTSFTAGYSKRFFGDSYLLDLQHKTKRLTNAITYDESIEVFDRYNYQQVDIGTFWCPAGSDNISILQCALQAEQPVEGDYELRRLSQLEPIQSNEFSLNKQFSWRSTLTLPRTSFILNANASRREKLETDVIDDTLTSSLTITRKISGKSNLTLLAQFDYLIFDKNNPEGIRQEDYYRTVSATYTKDLASSLSTDFTVQHVNRDSTVELYSYDEVRAIINVKKEF